MQSKQSQPLPNQKQRLGKLGEQLAKKHLLQKKLKFIAQNYQTRYGEIDLIFLDGQTLVFVEVKTRADDKLGLPEEAVTPAKMANFYKAAELYLQEFPQYEDCQCRFDVVAIEIKPRQIRHHEAVDV